MPDTRWDRPRRTGPRRSCRLLVTGGSVSRPGRTLTASAVVSLVGWLPEPVLVDRLQAFVSGRERSDEVPGAQLGEPDLQLELGRPAPVRLRHHLVLACPPSAAGMPPDS